MVNCDRVINSELQLSVVYPSYMIKPKRLCRHSVKLRKLQWRLWTTNSWSGCQSTETSSSSLAVTESKTQMSRLRTLLSGTVNSGLVDNNIDNYVRLHKVITKWKYMPTQASLKQGSLKQCTFYFGLISVQIYVVTESVMNGCRLGLETFLNISDFDILWTSGETSVGNYCVLTL